MIHWLNYKLHGWLFLLGELRGSLYWIKFGYNDHTELSFSFVKENVWHLGSSEILPVRMKTE